MTQPTKPPSALEMLREARCLADHQEEGILAIDALDATAQALDRTIAAFEREKDDLARTAESARQYLSKAERPGRGDFILRPSDYFDVKVRLEQIVTIAERGRADG